MLAIDAALLATVSGGATFHQRMIAVMAHDEMSALRVGNRLGDHMGLDNGASSDNSLGVGAGLAGTFVGMVHGPISALVHPSKGERLHEQWGMTGVGEGLIGPHR